MTMIIDTNKVNGPKTVDHRERFNRCGWRFIDFDYQHVPWAGAMRANIPENVRRLVYASQFKNTVDFGMRFHCGYSFEPVSTGDCKMGVPRPRSQGGEPAQVDHIIPVAVLGKNHPDNYQLLSDDWNKAKSAFILPQAVWHAYRCGETIKGARSFHQVYDVIMQQWYDDRYIDSPWPWWAEDSTGKPLFFGLDETTMKVSFEESIRIEREVKKPNILAFLEACLDDRVIDDVVRSCKVHYGFNP